MSAAAEGLARKAVHISMGAFALLLRYLTAGQAAGLALGALVFNLFALHPLTGGRLLRSTERRASFTSGIVLYPLAVLALILVFRRELHLAAAAWGLLAFGDGLAGLIGSRLGGSKLPWNPSKSWEGLAAFVAFGWLGAFGLGAWVRPMPPGDSVWFALGCLAAALAAGAVESCASRIDDNVLVPFFGGLVLYLHSLVDRELLAASAGPLARNAVIGLGVNLVFAGLAFGAGGVRASGVAGGVIVGTLLYTFSGIPGFLVLLLFFVLGTSVTKLGYARKAALGIAQARGGRRGAREAFANVGAAAAFAFLGVATGRSELFHVAFVAALATAAADTVSSEIGQAYGRVHYLSTTFRRVPAGTDGAVSVEGTAAGIAASGLIALAGLAVGLVTPVGAAVVVASAFAGSTLESILGATVERSLGLGNDVVNFANTVAGGCAALALARALRIG